GNIPKLERRSDTAQCRLLSSRIETLALEPLPHLADVDHVVPFDGRFLSGYDDAYASVDRIGSTGQHLVDGLPVVRDVGLQESYCQISHFVWVLADRGVDRTRGHIDPGQLIP